MVAVSQKIRAAIMLYGLGMSALYILLMAYTWMRAYFSSYNGIPHTMLFTVNLVGEADPEFVLLFLVVPVVLYTVWIQGNRVYDENFSRKQNF
jgi:hypothetical protein